MWRSLKNTILEEIIAFLRFSINMGINGRRDMKEYYFRKRIERMSFFVDGFLRK